MSDWYPGKRIAEWLGIAKTSGQTQSDALKTYYANLLNDPAMTEANRDAWMTQGRQAVKAYDPYWSLLSEQSGGAIKPPQYDAMFTDPLPENWDQLRGRGTTYQQGTTGQYGATYSDPRLLEGSDPHRAKQLLDEQLRRS